ncbi:MAG TPA: organomercurial lyase [Acidimicrobiia bacterium]|nr:organomercurial lyase [Acidimicrobiia bacterium]
MKTVYDAGRLLDADLTKLERDLAVSGFGALWARRACRPEELLPGSAAAGTAATMLARRGRAELDAAGAVVGVHGLTLRATRHRFLHRGQARHTWCAFDSVGIPAALAIDAVARTDCPSCQEPLTVVITEGVPERGRAVLWLPDPPTDDLMAQFCSCADLYCSTEHLRRRIDPAAIPGEITDLDAAAELGRQAWADVVGLRLGPGS